MSKKLLEAFFKECESFNARYPLSTNVVNIVGGNEKDPSTYVIMLTDDLTLFILRYNEKATGDIHGETFELANGDEIGVVYGEHSDIETFIDTVCDRITTTSDHCRPIHDKHGFQQLVLTRKALYKVGRYNMYNLANYTKESQKLINKNKIAIADVYINAINCSKMDPIHHDIISILSMVFNNISTNYREMREYELSTLDKSNKTIRKIHNAFYEYLPFELSAEALKILTVTLTDRRLFNIDYKDYISPYDEF